MKLKVAVLALLLACFATDASAVTFTAARELPGRFADVVTSGPPPAAINARGDAIVTWTGLLGGQEVAIGGANRLRAVGLPGLVGGIHALAMSPSGKALVAYDWFKNRGADEVAAYTVLTRGGSPGRVYVVDRKRGYTGRQAAAAQPDGSFVLLYKTARGFGAQRISSSGKPGRITRLGSVSLTAFASAPGGQIIACCRKGGATWRYASSRWSAVPSTGRVTSVATAAGRFQTASQGTALVDGSGRTFTVDRPAGVGAFGTGALVLSTQNGRWGVEIEQNGTFTPAANLPTDVAQAGIATAGSAAVLAWYDRTHQAYWSFANP